MELKTPTPNKVGHSREMDGGRAPPMTPLLQRRQELMRGETGFRKRFESSSEDDDPDKEEPLPKSAREKHQARRIVVIEGEDDDDDSDRENPLPKSARGRDWGRKEKESRKRPSCVLETSDDKPFNMTAKTENSKMFTQPQTNKQLRVESKEQQEPKPQASAAEFYMGPQINRQGRGKAADASTSNSLKDALLPFKITSRPIESSFPSSSKKGSSSSFTKTIDHLNPNNTSALGTSRSNPKPPLPNLPQQPKVKENIFIPSGKKPEWPKLDLQSSSSDRQRYTENRFLSYSSKTNITSIAPMSIIAKTVKPKQQDSKQVSSAKQNYMKHLARMNMKPKNLGTKEIPVGAPDCLKGLTFVITGILDSLEREDCVNLITRHGGRVTGAVSSKTDYLITGDEPGEKKIETALKHLVPKITEDELFNMIRIRKSIAPSKNEHSVERVKGINSVSFNLKTVSGNGWNPDKSRVSLPVVSSRIGPEVPVPPVSKFDSSRVSLPTSFKRSDTLTFDSAVKKSSNDDIVVPEKTDFPEKAEKLWVDKHQPQSLKDVVGQSYEISSAKKLVKWLKNWFIHHGNTSSKLQKNKKSLPSLPDIEGKSFKAALLSGPPGIGKTVTAKLAIKEAGYDYFELNASDTRNKKWLQEHVKASLSSKTVQIVGGKEYVTRKHVLILDEVDGMSGNEDRGGIQELIALIKSSKVPIICICNDRGHQKIRSLANYCFDLRFYKPSFEQIRSFVSSICFKEKISIIQENVRQLILSTDSDLRQILHQLEFFKETKSSHSCNPMKDIRFGPWDVTRKVFLKTEHAKMTIHDKMNIFFQDYNIGPLFVQENYLKWRPFKASGNVYKHMYLLSNSASAIAEGDLVETMIRRRQNYGLLPVQAIFSSYLLGEYMESQQIGGVDFPQWFGKNSNGSKRVRFLQTLHAHTRLHVSSSLDALNLDYLPYLRSAITKPLLKGDATKAVNVMKSYSLMRDDLESINEISLMPGIPDPMKEVETKVKTAFTKNVNKIVLSYSTVKQVGAGKRKVMEEHDLGTLHDYLEEEAVDEDEDSVQNDPLIKVRRTGVVRKRRASSILGRRKTIKFK